MTKVTKRLLTALALFAFVMLQAIAVFFLGVIHVPSSDAQTFWIAAFMLADIAAGAYYMFSGMDI